MEYADDPDYRRIRCEFLEHINKFHAEHEYTLDWQGLCDTSGITVQASKINQYARPNGRPRIYFNADDPANRKLFSCLHELSHFLFEEEGFRALLEDKYSPDFSQKTEEMLVNEAAATLLIPRHVLEKAVKKYGCCPRAVFGLSQRAGSLAACLVRLVLAYDVEAWGLIMRNGRLVEFSCTNTRYPLGYDYCIEPSHKINEAWDGLLDQRAALPYRSGKRKVHHPMRAYTDGRRVVALFARAFPTLSNSHQPSLGLEFV